MSARFSIDLSNDYYMEDDDGCIVLLDSDVEDECRDDTIAPVRELVSRAFANVIAKADADVVRKFVDDIFARILAPESPMECSEDPTMTTPSKRCTPPANERTLPKRRCTLTRRNGV
jgi:hypothetical protein